MTDSPISSPATSTVPARPAARVPRRFAAGTLMILIAAYGLVIRGLMALGMPMAGVVTIAGTLTAAGAAQVFLFRGERPRYASILLGAIAAPVCAGIYAIIDSEFAAWFFFYQTPPQVLVTVCYFVLMGAILGYVSGCIAAGLFLMLGRIPWLQVESNHAQLAPIDELKHHSAPHFWQRFLSSISLYQLDRPIREFAATAGILLVGFLPLAIYMPLWRVAYYVPIVTGITIGVAFLRTGLRQLGWYWAGFFSIVSLVASIGPAVFAARISWGHAAVATEIPIIAIVLVSLLIGMTVTATVGWLGWIRRSLLKHDSSRIEIVVLLILIVLSNILGCVYLASRLRQPAQVALRRVQHLNGHVGFDFPNRNLLKGQAAQILLSQSPVTDDDLRLMTALNTAIAIDVSSSEITDAGMRHLQSFPKLNSLNLGSPHVTDAGIKHLAGFKSLGALYLHDTKITSRGVRSLKPLNIRIISLSGPQLDASVLDELADMPTLVSVSLQGVDLSGADVSKLASIPFLKSLFLVDCHLRDDDLRGVTALPKLEELRLTRNPITDQGIEVLQGLRQLRKVDLYGTRTTPTGAAKLEVKIPNCVILGH